MSGDTRDFNNIETRAVIMYFYIQQVKAPKEINVFLKEILGEHFTILCHRQELGGPV